MIKPKSGTERVRALAHFKTRTERMAQDPQATSRDVWAHAATVQAHAREIALDLDIGAAAVELIANMLVQCSAASCPCVATGHCLDMQDRLQPFCDACVPPQQQEWFTPFTGADAVRAYNKLVRR